MEKAKKKKKKKIQTYNNTSKYASLHVIKYIKKTFRIINFNLI